MELNLNNKVAVVSASSNGIGLQIALDLAKHGAIVYMAARNEEKTNEIIKQYPDLNLKYVNFDANNSKSFHFVNEVYKQENRIDILVNNFGTTNVAKDFDIVNTKYEDYLAILEQNSRSVFIPSQDAIKVMANQKSGSIINISSVGGIIPDLARISYCSSKAVVNNLTLNIAAQAAKYNVRCNAVMPGFIKTDASMKNMPEIFLKTFLKNTPLDRLGEVEDISNAVLYLASDLSTYVTGETISVAGGFGKFTPLFSEFNKK